MDLQPDQLFTATNIASAGVATVAVNVVTNTFHKLLSAPPKWTAFLAALVLAYAVVGMQTAPQWFDWLLAFFNACLLFCSALGVNEIGVAATRGAGKGAIAVKPVISSWVS